MNTLVLNYANPTATKDPYWVRIEQDKVDDAATVDQAADVLDALFQIEPCNREESEEPETTEPVDQEEAADTVADVLSLPACDMAFDGSLDTTIRIYRSHLSEPYTLRLQGGTEVETITESGPVKVTAEISETVTLDYPVVTGFYCSPAPVSRTGNTLRFEASLVGRQFSASYQSEWDKMTVRITGVDGEPGECTAIAFHHGVASALNLETPDIDEADLNLCPLSRWNLHPTDYEVTCYKIIEVTQRCTCSGDEVGSYTTEQVVPCPNQEMRCPNNETTCMHLLGTEPLTEWVECAGDSEIPGRPGQNYLIASPAYYEEVCCQKPSATLPQCPTKRTIYKAELPIERGQAFWRDLYGDATRFKPVAPPAGICGEWIIEQRIDSGNCCDGVSTLSLVGTHSAITIAPGADAIITIEGGRPPYRWNISGTGVSFIGAAPDGSIATLDPWVRVHAASFACGWAPITVTDGCSTINYGLRVTQGAWVQLGSFAWTSSGPYLIGSLLAQCNNQVLYDATYLGYTEDGTKSQLSADNRYWMGGGTALPANNPMVPGRVGVPFQYGGAYTTYGVPSGAGCLDGCSLLDPIIGVFYPILATGCEVVGGNVYSRTLTAPVYIYQWGC